MGRRGQYDRDEILKHLRAFAEELGAPPISSQWPDYTRRHPGVPHQSTISRMFVTWDEALIAAGVLDARRTNRGPSDHSDGESTSTAEAGYRRQIKVGVIALRGENRRYWHWGRREYVEAAVMRVTAEKHANCWLGVGTPQ